MLRFPIFIDPYYGAELHAEFEPSDVIAIEQKTVSLFLRGKHTVTYVTLKNGTEYALKGDLKDQIEAARQAVATAS